MAIRIVLIERQRLFRESFRSLLRTQPDFEVVGDAGDATAALSIAAASSPHVVVVDSGVVGEELLRDVARLASAPRIVALESQPSPVRLQALGSAVGGIFCRDDSSDEAFTAIRTVAAGRTYVTPRLLQSRTRDGAEAPDHLLRSLTAREQEVFDLVLRGQNTAAIARRLSLSPRTVETHRAHVMRKLGVHSTLELVRVAARNGLLPS